MPFQVRTELSGGDKGYLLRSVALEAVTVTVTETTTAALPLVSRKASKAARLGKPIRTAREVPRHHAARDVAAEDTKQVSAPVRKLVCRP